MSNILTGRKWTLDTVGIISETPLFVKRIIYEPNAAGDVAVFNHWDEGVANCVSSTFYGLDFTATITSGTTITATTSVLTSTITAGSIFHIVASGGAAANLGRELVTTAGNNTVVVCSQAGWTNEATIKYTANVYNYRLAERILAGASDASPTTIFYGDKGRFFPNLILNSISTSSEVYIELV